MIQRLSRSRRIPSSSRKLRSKCPVKRIRRPLRNEALESRLVMAVEVNPFHNWNHPLDVNDDGKVSNLDAYALLGDLSQNGARTVVFPNNLTAEGETPAAPLMGDINADGKINNLDAYTLLKALKGEGEGSVYSISLKLTDSTGALKAGNTVALGETFQLRMFGQDMRNFANPALLGALQVVAKVNFDATLVQGSPLRPGFPVIGSFWSQDPAEQFRSFSSGMQIDNMNNTTGVLDNWGVGVGLGSINLPDPAGGIEQLVIGANFKAAAAKNDALTAAQNQVTTLSVMANDPATTLATDTMTAFNSSNPTGLEKTNVYHLASDVSSPPGELNPSTEMMFGGVNYTIHKAAAFTITGVTNGMHGTVAIVNGGTQVSYTNTDGFSGADSFTYTISDGQGHTDTATVNLTVQEVNQPPIANADSFSTDINTPAVLNLDTAEATILSNDKPGPAYEVTAGQTVSIVDVAGLTGNGSVMGPQGGTLTIANFGTPSATVTYTPATNFAGTEDFNYTITDNGTTGGVSTPLTATGVIHMFVGLFNHAPTFNAGANQTVNEDAGAQTVTNWITSISPGPATESGQTVSFNIQSNSNTGLFSAGPTISANGTLSYTPAANASGSATITYVAMDNGGTANNGVDTSAVQTATITVNSVNDRPTFTATNPPSVLEDAAAQTITNWVTNFNPGPANESGQTVLAYIVSNVSNPGLFSVGPAVSNSGTLTYTLASNANGSSTFQVQVQDSGSTLFGGIDTSLAQTFTLSVGAVNDVPVFSKGADQTVLEDAGAQTVTNWATGINAGAANESGQTLTFTTTNNNNALFSVQPSVSATGTLTFTPAANAFGSATVTVSLKDNGSTANGGVDTSATQTFTITITPVNDAPTFTKGANQTFTEDSGLHTITGWATAMSVGPANESGQTIQGFQVINNTNSALFATLPSVNAAGTLSFQAANNTSGFADITIQVVDSGDSNNGGTNLSASQTFRITITEVNDVPTAAHDDLNVIEGQAQTFQPTAVTTNDSPGPNEATQTLKITSIGPSSVSGASVVLNVDGSFTYTPKPGFLGTDTFSYTVQDNGTTNGVNAFLSATNTITVTVLPARRPLAVDDSATTNEDTAVIINALSNDKFNAGVTVAVQATNPAHGTVVVNGDNTITYTPAADYNGPDSFMYTVTESPVSPDGPSTATVTLTVNAKNDAPVFTKGADPTVLEDAGAQTILNWATGISAGPANESGQTVSFTTTVLSNAGLFSVAPQVSANGTLTFTAGTNANGSATIQVVLMDSGGTANGGVNTSAVQTFTINVTPVNDVPTFTKGPDVSVLENSGQKTVANWATNIGKGPANESGQTLSFIVTPGNASLFSVQPSIDPATGTLTFTPAADANGSTSVSVQLMDNGGTAGGGVDTSPVQTLTINVTAVNNAPSFTLVAPTLISLTEGVGVTFSQIKASGMLAGPPNESGQTLNFIVTPSNTAFFSVQPTIDPVTGQLNFTLADNVNGAVTLDVKLHDNGGTANGGVDTSASQTLTIAVSEVNNAPTANADAFFAVTGGGAQTFRPLANDSRGPANESSQTLTITNITPVNPPGGGFGTIVVANDGQSFTFDPVGGFLGDATFTYTITDNGTTAGMADPKTAMGTITISVVQFQPSTLNGIVFEDVNNNGAFDNAAADFRLRELAMGDVEVTLTGTDRFTQTAITPITVKTLADGSYSFGSVRPGTYTVSVAQPELTYGGPAFVTRTITIGVLGGVVEVAVGVKGSRGVQSPFVNQLEYTSSMPKTGFFSMVKLTTGQYWFSLLDGWAGYKKVTATLASTLKTVTVVGIDAADVSHTITMKTTHESRFQADGTDGAGNYLLRFIGTANDFFPTASPEGLDAPEAPLAAAAIANPTLFGAAAASPATASPPAVHSPALVASVFAPPTATSFVAGSNAPIWSGAATVTASPAAANAVLAVGTPVTAVPLLVVAAPSGQATGEPSSWSVSTLETNSAEKQDESKLQARLLVELNQAAGETAAASERSAEETAATTKTPSTPKTETDAISENYWEAQRALESALEWIEQSAQAQYRADVEALFATAGGEDGAEARKVDADAS